MISSKDLQTQLIKDPTAAAWAVYKELERLHNENIALKRRCDPLLAENAILGNLSMPSSAENTEPLQVGAMLTLVAMYDRKLQRDSFVEIAESVTGLFGMLGRLSIAESILHMMEKGVFTQAKIEDAAKELIAYGESERHKILKIMKLVQQVPTSEDTIN
jgi:hypothetical protein